MTDPALVWRDDVIEMLKTQLREAEAKLGRAVIERDEAIERAERAEGALSNLKEEIADAARPTVG